MRHKVGAGLLGEVVDVGRSCAGTRLKVHNMDLFLAQRARAPWEGWLGHVGGDEGS